MLTALGFTLLAVGVLASIALHELGHLIPAKRGGVKCTQYMIGFGPTLWSRTRGETEYGVKAIPLGGYVRMIGMFPPKADGTQRASTTGFFGNIMDEARRTSAEEVEPGQEHRAFYTKSVRRKLLVMFGGPSVNLVLAILLFTLAFTVVGVPQFSDTSKVGAFSQCQLPLDSKRTECEPGDAPAPAVQAGLKVGDSIESINGVAVTQWQQVPDLVRASGGQPVQMLVRGSDGAQRNLSVTPVMQRDGTGQVRPMVGISPAVDMVPMPVAQVPGQIFDLVKRTTVAVLSVPQRMVGVWHAAFSDQERDPNGPIGMLGAARLGGEIADDNAMALRMKTSSFISLLASINLALFVFNMVPLPPLDGGHIAGALWEGARRQLARLRKRPDPGYVDVVKLLPVAYTVATLLIAMSVLLLYADVVNPLRLGG